MYPQRELRTLLLNKARLRRRVGHQRRQCVEAAAELGRPLAWIDAARARWHRLSLVMKISALALVLLARHRRQRRPSRLATWLRWGWSALGLLRGLKRLHDNRAVSRHELSRDETAVGTDWRVG